MRLKQQRERKTGMQEPMRAIFPFYTVITDGCRALFVLRGGFGGPMDLVSESETVLV